MIRILDIDIETAPNQAYVWGLFRQNIGINQIVEPGYTLCFAAKWEGEDEVIFRSLHMHTMQEMLVDLWQLLDEADVVRHFNGKKFDMPTINREFVKHDMGPPSPYHQIDLYWVVRSNFRFASNKLDFVCQELGLGNKVHNRGMSLWTDCMETLNIKWGEDVPEHVDQAWQEMKEYNEQDVHLLPRLYDKLQPWIKNHPNRGLWMERGEDPICPNCGSKDLRFKSYKKTRVLEYKQYHCGGCGSYPRARTAEKSSRGRKDIMT